MDKSNHCGLLCRVTDSFFQGAFKYVANVCSFRLGWKPGFFFCGSTFNKVVRDRGPWSLLFTRKYHGEPWKRLGDVCSITTYSQITSCQLLSFEHSLYSCSSIFIQIGLRVGWNIIAALTGPIILNKYICIMAANSNSDESAMCAIDFTQFFRSS